MPQTTATVPFTVGAACPDRAAYDVNAVVRHLSHELRQPLSTIEAAAYYLAMVVPTADIRVRQQVEKIQQMVCQTNWILSDAIHFLQAAPPRFQPIDLCESISQAIAELASRDTVSWVCRGGPETHLVRADPAQAQHLVRTVLAVFRQIAHEYQTLTLSVESSESELRLRCVCARTNLGAGQLSDLFEPFSPHLPAGWGLALSSVRRIAEVHGGKAELRAEGDAGVSLTVSLPRALPR